jgi:hypothetical protein
MTSCKHWEVAVCKLRGSRYWYMLPLALADAALLGIRKALCVYETRKRQQMQLEIQLNDASSALCVSLATRMPSEPSSTRMCAR